MKHMLLKGLAVLLMTGVMICPSSTASAFPDVKNNAEYAQAVNYVSNAGIMVGDESGNFNPNKTVTRAEMAVILCNMLGAQNNLLSGKSVFTDVPADHWAKPYVVAAVALGVISGYGDGRFGVSDFVTYEQAVTMIVSASGWGAESDARGGYPIGYLSVAAEQGYLKGITGTRGKTMTRGEIAQILYNASGKQIEPGSGEDRISIPHRLILAEDYGIPEEYLPYFEFFEDGHCRFLVNWAHSVELFETEYEVQKNGRGQTVIVCAPDRGGAQFIEQSEGTWSYSGESLGFVQNGDNFNVDGLSHVIVSLHSESIDLFKELEGKTFIFSSGVGAWRTELTFGVNGKFQGFYLDSDMGDCADTYPDGTVYVCDFSGDFIDMIQIDNETYSMRIGTLRYGVQPGTQEIRDGMRYIYSEPYGMENADVFYVYLPGRYTGDLPQEFLEWAAMPSAWHDIPAILPMWGLYNEGGKAGFICDTD